MVCGLEQAWEAYVATFKDWQPDAGEAGGAATEAAPDTAEAHQAQETEKEWKFRAAQLTYNSKVGEWTSRDPAVLRPLLDRVVAHVRNALEAYGVVGLSATMEESTHADEGSPHVHAHVYFHLTKSYHRRTLDPFKFEGIKPHVEVNRAGGKAYEPAVKRGHYYVYVNKIGSIINYTDWPPFQEYGVEGWWIDNWLKQGKLSRDTYLRIAAQITVGFQRRLADVRAAERYERELAVREHVAAEQVALAGSTYPIKDFAVVNKFLSFFDGRKHHRRPILVIRGGSNLGKSLLAAEVLRKVGRQLGIHDYLEVTVEGSETMDLNEFDHRKHAGVLLDGVGDTYLLWRNREVLQGRPKVAKGAQSATMVYAYAYTLCNRAVVATCDLSALHLDAFETDHWLSNERIRSAQIGLEHVGLSASEAPTVAFT